MRVIFNRKQYVLIVILVFLVAIMESMLLGWAFRDTACLPSPLESVSPESPSKLYPVVVNATLTVRHVGDVEMTCVQGPESREVYCLKQG